MSIAASPNRLNGLGMYPGPDAHRNGGYGQKGGHYSLPSSPVKGAPTKRHSMQAMPGTGQRLPLSPAKASPQWSTQSPLRMPPSPTRGQGTALPPDQLYQWHQEAQSSPTSATSPRSLRITNPDPPSAPSTPPLEQALAQHSLQAQQSQQFALRPTHTLTAPRTGLNSFSSVPPSGPPPFAPNASSPLKPRSDENRSPWGHSRGMSAPPEQLDEIKAARGKKKGNGSMRPSKSTEFLLKLRGGDNQRGSSPTKHTSPTSDDEEDDEDEKIRLPTDYQRPASQPNARRSWTNSPTNGAAPSPTTGQATGQASSWWSSSKEQLAAQFPTPPGQRSQLPYSHDSSGERTPVATSDDTFHTASPHASPALVQPIQLAPSPPEWDESVVAPVAPNSGTPTGSSTPTRKKSTPYPAQASPHMSKREKRRSEPMMAVHHSKNAALLAAETGGMLVFSDEGSFAQGRGPGEISRPASAGGHVSSQGHPQQQQGHSQQRLPPFQFPVPQLRGPAPHATGHIPSDRLSTGSAWGQNDRQSYGQPTSGGAPFDARRMSETSTTPSDPAPTSAEFGGGKGHRRSHSDGIALLARQGTLFHPASNTERQSLELDVMLGKPRSRRLSANKLLPAPPAAEPTEDKVRLEASKMSRARVELGVVLERECVIEGGEVRGRLEVVVRGGKRGKGLRIGGGKVRVLGYEEVGNKRHIFYQHQYHLPEFSEPSKSSLSLFADSPDDEGFCLAREGTHCIGFNMHLPISDGAKGSFTCPTGKGPNVRYVVVGSIKLHIPTTGKRAIAHFYRPVVILPYFNPAIVLLPLRNPVVRTVEHGLGWNIIGEKGIVQMHVALARHTWVAGQRVWCEVGVQNGSKKKIHKMTLAILQNINTYGPSVKGSQAMDPRPIASLRRKVSEEVTEADFMDVGSGRVTGRGWWTGLEPGEANRWDMSVPIPSGMISIPRSRYVEVTYTLRVTINGSIYVDVPLHIINFLSLDPPPMPSDARRARVLAATTQQTTGIGSSELSRSVYTSPMEGALQDESPTLGHGQNSSLQAHAGYTSTQLREASTSNLTARTTPTSFLMEKIMQPGRPAEPQVTMPTDGTQDMMPRATSPDSMYSTVNGNRSAMSTLKRKTMSESGHSIDDVERDHEIVEEERRDGRFQSLAVIQNEGLDHDDAVASDHENEGTPTKHLSQSSESQYSSTNHWNSNPTSQDHDTGANNEPVMTPEEGSEIGFDGGDDEYDDKTPVASPRVSPLITPSLPARSPFLHHISEEEEPLDDDQLDEIMSLSGPMHAGGLDYEDDEDAEDLMADQAEHSTPRLSSEAVESEAAGRRSLEDRLRVACGRSSPAEAAVAGVFAGTVAAGAAGAAAGAQADRGSVEDLLSESRHSVDYAEPLDVDQMSLATDLDRGYDADGMSDTTSQGSPGRRTHASMPSWSSGPSSMPSPSQSRDVRMESMLTGRTPEGRYTMPDLDSHFDSDNHLGLRRDHEQRDLALFAADTDDSELVPPSVWGSGNVRTYRTTQSGSDSSHSAGSDEQPPPLARSDSETSSRSGEGLDALTPPPPSQPVYTLPLPEVPPGAGPRSSRTALVPDRFRPAPREMDDDDDAQSMDSHATHTTTSSIHDGVILPAVKARVAQIESRHEALRRFTVASSAGLSSPTSSQDAGRLSPVHSGMSGRSSASSKRPSYTAALAPRSPAAATFGMMFSSSQSSNSHSSHSATSNGSCGLSQPTSPTAFSPRFEYDQASPRPGQSSQQQDWRAALAAPVASGDLSSSAARLLSRALSSASTSTSATDVERALGSPRLGGGAPGGPRGPRPNNAAPLSPGLGMGTIGSLRSVASSVSESSNRKSHVGQVGQMGQLFDGSQSNRDSDTNGTTKGTPTNGTTSGTPYTNYSPRTTANGTTNSTTNDTPRTTNGTTNSTTNSTSNGTTNGTPNSYGTTNMTPDSYTNGTSSKPPRSPVSTTVASFEALSLTPLEDHVPSFRGPMLTGSPALQPKLAAHPLRDMASACASLEGAPSEDSHSGHWDGYSAEGSQGSAVSRGTQGTGRTSNADPDGEVVEAAETVSSSGSDFGNTGWTGGLRLPQLRWPVGPR